MSAWTNSTYSITLNARGQKLYGDDTAGGDISISIDSNLSVSAQKITFAQVDTSSQLDSAIDATRIVPALLSTSSESSASISAYQIALPVISISSSCDAIFDAEKIAFSSSDISIDCSSNQIAYKIMPASSSAEITSNSSSIALKILFAQIQVSGLLVKVTVGKEILLAKIVMTANVSSRNIPAIRFSPSITEDTQAIRPLLLIDDKPISEHNRQINSSVIQSFIQNTNWAARKSRYYKNSGGRRSFSISWSWLPNSRDMTVDNKYGRDFIKQIGADPKVHSLKILNLDSDGTSPYSETEYNVIVKNYQETLVRRDLVSNTYYWDCSIDLEEI